ncbi:TPA: hypothetical protein ACS29Y_001202 [Raoultella planticola]|uniref:hypothetical protein n=1 Tax=Raoultella planticola TaxID=575 RepID=UPI000FD84D5E|nr:hypothetical protein [Raoultella planticola]HDG9791028.1 hypothetical protein [Raoultella planticola]HDH7773058.1 hypothetical protein [Raoultella planticola]
MLIIALFSKFSGRISIISKSEAYLFLFTTWSTLILAVSPSVFSNLQVSIDPDDMARNGGRPNPSIISFAQIGYLIIHFICLSLIIKCRRNDLWSYYNFDFKKIVIISSWITCIFGFISYALRLIGVSKILIPIFYNNPGYAQLIDAALRFQAGFPEASFCGAFLGAAFWVAIYHRRILLSCLLIAAMILSVSGSALISFFAGFCLYFFYYGRKKLLITLIILFLIVFCLYIFGVLEYLIAFILDKGNSHSGDVRYSQAVLALDIFYNTYGFGIGVGITRGGGGFLNLLATTGFVGTLLFILFVTNILRKESFDKVIYIVSLLSAMIFTIPDVSYPVLWGGLFLIAATANKNK